MSADYERQLLRRARELADLEELAIGVVTILGAARNAGLDPDALGGLVGAAAALGADSLATYTAGKDGLKYEHETAFLLHVASSELAIAERLTAAAKIRDRVVAANDAALHDFDRARRRLAAARAMATREPCDGCHAAKHAEIIAAEAAIADCRTRGQYCEVAGEILDEITQRLRYALARIRAVPGDLGEVYESVYNLIRRGGVMPHEGRWVTGQNAATA